MDTKTIYSTKAEKYAKYRWDYSTKAVDAIFEIAQLSNDSVIADIGAGTGILTRHFVDKVQRVYAIEPNREMRYIAIRELGNVPSVTVIEGSAAETGLPEESVDLITVAQAIHWFDPEPARREMLRICRKKGWLAILRNYGTDQERNKAIGKLMSAEYGADFSVTVKKPQEKSVSYFFGNNEYQRKIFPFQFRQNWEEFMGALTSASYMPDDDNPLFNVLEQEAKRFFSQASENGYLMVRGETEMIIGQPSQ